MNGNLLAQDFGGYNADLSYQDFPYDGEFILVASDKSGNDAGDFSLSTSGGSIDASLDECHMVYDGFAHFNSTTIKVETNQSNLSFSWSNGHSGPNIYVTPNEDTEYSVTVTNSMGCSTVLSTFVEIQDVTCGNGNNTKVSVCHINNGNGQAQQKCISENGVWQHINNGQGHEDCYLGTCNYESICEGTNSNLTEELSEQFEPHGIIDLRKKQADQSHKVFPNPTSDLFQIVIDPKQSVSNVVVFDTNGKAVLTRNYSSEIKDIQINLLDIDASPGLYFVQVNSTEKTEVHRMLLIR